MLHFVAVVVVVSLIVVAVQSQEHECTYIGGPDGQFVLNLTSISAWTLELETPNFFAYYTPCGNRMHCQQGNAAYQANVAQFKQGANVCAYYLSIDHHQPAVYSFHGASWHFHYEDGEMCQQTNFPRRTDIYMHCNDESHSPAFFYGFEEPHLCEYVLDIKSTLACVPENTFNANCQWRLPNGTGGYNSVDLSALKGQVLRSRIANLGNGYEMYLSPCANGLQCHQQYFAPVMSMIENHATGTCDHYLSVWESGRVVPYYRDEDPSAIHWSFHYYNGQKCSNGELGEETVRYYCELSADPYTIINATSDGDCRFEFNLATKFACAAADDIIIQAKAFIN